MTTNTSNCSCCSFNPYPHIGEQHKEGLDAVINAIFGGSSSSSAFGTAITENEFIQLVCSLIASEFGDDPDAFFEAGKATSPMGQVLCGILPNTINSYCHSSGLERYNGMQQSYINLMLGSIYNVPIDSIKSRLIDIENKLSESPLSIEEKTPLFQALSIGTNDYDYWIEKLETPGLWTPFLHSNYAVNYDKIPYWVSASMEGSLIYANRALPTLPPLNTALDIIATLISGTGLVAGKVIFKWIPKPKSGW